MRDKEIIKLYFEGWYEEVDGVKPRDWFKNDLSKRAYMMGRLDYVIGDDVSSNNLQTEEEIVKRIKDGI